MSTRKVKGLACNTNCSHLHKILVALQQSASHSHSIRSPGLARTYSVIWIVRHGRTLVQHRLRYSLMMMFDLKSLAAIGRRHWPICWCCLDRRPGSFDVEDATTLSWSSAAVSEWVHVPVISSIVLFSILATTPINTHLLTYLLTYVVNSHTCRRAVNTADTPQIPVLID